MGGALCRKDSLRGLCFDSLTPSISRQFLCGSYFGSLTDLLTVCLESHIVFFSAYFFHVFF